MADQTVDSNTTVRIAGIRTSVLGRDALADVVAAPAGPRPQVMLDINGHAVALYHSNAAYARALDAADFVHADGQAMVFAARLSGGPRIAGRTATTDLIHDVAARAEREGRSFYLLGGSEDINAACAERLSVLYPQLRIAGRHHGYFDDAAEPSVIDAINAAQPDIVWVGLGKPREQLMAMRLRERLSCGWIITCGGCFNFIAGEYRRAPLWMQSVGLEWLYRAASEPRLAWRYLTTNPVAIYWILRNPT